MKPKLSIIMPVYNREDLVGRALDSIPLSRDYQIILIDDGSVDGSLKILDEWYTEHLPMIHESSCGVRFDENKGVAAAMNKGFDLAEGEYIVSLSSDDYYLRDFTDFLPYLDGENDLVYFDLEINDGSIMHLDEETKNNLVGAVKFIRRDFLGNTRIPSLMYEEDVPFSQELYNKNPKEVFTSIVLKHYNYPHEGSLSWLAEKEKDGDV